MIAVLRSLPLPLSRAADIAYRTWVAASLWQRQSEGCLATPDFRPSLEVLGQAVADLSTRRCSDPPPCPACPSLSCPPPPADYEGAYLCAGLLLGALIGWLLGRAGSVRSPGEVTQQVEAVGLPVRTRHAAKLLFRVVAEDWRPAPCRGAPIFDDHPRSKINPGKNM